MRVMAHPLSSEGDAQPYTRLLYEAIERAGVEVEPLRTAAVVRRPPDVVHLHWPEHALQHRGVERYRRALLLVASVRLARRRGTVLVYTAHNATPHDLEVSRFGRWFLESIDRQVDTVLILGEASREELARARPRLPRGRMVHTPHGHFRDAYPAPPPVEVARASFGIAPDRPTVAFVGQVRPYNGVTDLVEAVRRLHERLEIVAPERIRVELDKLLVVPRPSAGLWSG